MSVFPIWLVPALAEKRRPWPMLALCRSAVCLIAWLALECWPAVAAPPRSILVLDQSDVRGPFYYQIFSAFRAAVNASPGAPVSIYVESLDLSRFAGPTYEQSLQAHLRLKYQDKPIGVVVAIGDTALEYVSRWRTTLWPGVPVVFSMVDETTLVRLNAGRWRDRQYYEIEARRHVDLSASGSFRPQGSRFRGRCLGRPNRLQTLEGGNTSCHCRFGRY